MTIGKATTDSPRSVERADFIQAMRSLASSVTVVTTGGAAGCHGATVSAFCSVSADPPMVLVCLNAESRIAQTVAENGGFCVNVLDHSKQELADRFAGRFDNVLQDRFDGVDLEDGVVKAPIITGCTAFRCDVNDSYLSGSHMIFIGRVVEIKGNIPEPLIYYNGNYHHLGPKNLPDSSHEPATVLHARRAG
ncbi:MAG: flavin reductase family protein [Arenicella sp.]